MSTANVTPELAVRRYLQFLAAPESLVDENELRVLESAVDSATDPIDRLRAINAMQMAKVVDGGRLKADFIANASEFAKAEAIGVGAFREMGVSDDVLRAAGLMGDRRSRRTHGGDDDGRSHRRGRSNRRSPRLHLEEVESALPVGEFKLAELAAVIDREVNTTRNYLGRLVADGKVEVVGEDATGRGKPAKIYRRS